MKENKNEKLIELFADLVEDHPRTAEMFFATLVLVLLSVLIEAVELASITTSIILCGGGVCIAFAIGCGALDDRV